jgi:transposase
MKAQVRDISDTLHDMAGEMRQMREIIESQHADICRLTRLVEGLNAKLRKRDKENEELKARLAKYGAPDKNSGNSSTPSSKESIKDEAIRRTKTLRRPTGRKPGGQQGHEGSTLKMARTPDETEEVSANYCTRCGASLEDCERILDHVTQVVSIPELRPVVKEIRHYITVCRKCGERVQPHAPRKRGSNAVVYDATVKSLAVYLSVVMFLPYGRMENFFREVFGLEISQGSFVNWVGEARKNTAPAIEKIKECIMKSAVVGFDESGLYCNRKLDWTWIAQTVYFTLYFHGSGRSHKELEERFGSSLERMVAVTDRHSAYFTLNFLDHQVCMAHLLRELQYLGELDKEQQWSKNVESLLQEAVHERNENPQAVIDKEPWLLRLDTLLMENLEHMKEQFGQLKKGLIKCRHYRFNFLENPAIPPDNNASERGIRKVKIKMKNSGTFRSDQGADAFLDLLSIVETTKKHNNSPYAAIHALF